MIDNPGQVERLLGKYAVGGETLLEQKQETLRGAAMLLQHLGHDPHR